MARRRRIWKGGTTQHGAEELAKKERNSPRKRGNW